jgi:hypothetical protein
MYLEFNGLQGGESQLILKFGLWCGLWMWIACGSFVHDFGSNSH